VLVDRQTFDFYQSFLGYPKVTVAEVRASPWAGFELALMADISVVAADTGSGCPPPGSWARRSGRCASSSTSRTGVGSTPAAHR
jgi:hypothetical protein